MDLGAERIIRRLNEAGYEAYAVGGCVRDALMGSEPHDWDITTSAVPETVKRLFSHTFDTGIEHGTVTVLSSGAAYEVTTFRIDGVYTDHRRPDSVTFAGSLYEDVARRDFTINAMAYHPDKGLIDYFDGQGDLKRKLIRCVGDPMKRFDEDALRMLRAVRFSAKLGFSIDPATWEAIVRLSDTIADVSKERILDEVTKTLVSDHPERLLLAETSGLAGEFCEEFKEKGVLEFEKLGLVRASRELRFAMLMRHMVPERAGAALRELKADNALRKGTVRLLEHIHDPLPKDEVSMRRLMHDAGRDLIPDLLDLRLAAEVDTEAGSKEAHALFASQKDMPVTLADLAVSGRDVIAQGVTPGKDVGECLEYLLNEVIKDPEKNTSDQLKQESKRWKTRKETLILPKTAEN